MKKIAVDFATMLIVAITLLSITACANIKQGITLAATTAAKAQCELPPAARYAERLAYYNANGERRLLVGFCEGDADFAAAVTEYIEKPAALKEAYEAAFAGDDPYAILNALIASGVAREKYVFDADGCILLPSAGKFCPSNGDPPAPPE